MHKHYYRYRKIFIFIVLFISYLVEFPKPVIKKILDCGTPAVEGFYKTIWFYKYNINKKF